MSTLDPETRERAAETDPSLTHEAKGETYTIRRFRPGDTRGVLELHDAVDFRLGGTEAWLDWKFADNPFLAHTSIFVAEHDGDIVGARPFVAFRLRAGPRTAVGLQTADTMVHPDHRSRGIFSRMNDLAFGYYRQREPEVLFSIPNSRSRPAYLDLGAKLVSPVRSHLRIETPSRFVEGKVGEWVPERTKEALDGVVNGYLNLRDRQHNGDSPGDITVERHATVPVETLAALGSSEIPRAIHAARDKQFYEWRFANPLWEYDCFVAKREGDPFAAMVTGTRAVDGRTVTRLSDVVPLAGEERLHGVAAILSRLLTVRQDTDVFTFAGTALPSELLRQFGFQPDDELPLSPLSNQTVLITMPLHAVDDEGGNGWTLEGRDITDPTSWQLPFCEQNTG